MRSRKHKPRQDVDTKTVSSPAIYQLKIFLDEITPRIWRRVLVPSDVTLLKLHDVLQAVMGWKDSHLHQYACQGQRYTDYLSEARDHNSKDERKTRLDHVLLLPGQMLQYEYDFGDGWIHHVELEEITQNTDGKGFRPICLEGERNCPPEDCGGPGGYEEVLKAVTNPNDPEYEELAYWAGDYEPEKFDLKKISRHLKKIR